MAFDWIDGHLDLAYIAMSVGDIRTDASDRSRRCVSLPALVRGNVRVVAATIFVERGSEAASTPWGYRDENDWQGANRAAELQMAYYEQLESEGLVRIVRTRSDLHDQSDRARPKLIILMEGADPIRDASDAARWHARGVRMVGLTWALGSRFAGGNQSGGALTSAGRELVAALDALHIVHDASHLSDVAFDDLLSATSRPIVASHSNARALMAHNERHITDDKVREIARRGGVVGLNLYGRFLANDRPALLEDAINHVQHITDVAQSHNVCVLGSDLDGGFLPELAPAQVRGCDCSHALTDALAGRGWNNQACENFAGKNWMRVFDRALAGS